MTPLRENIVHMLHWILTKAINAFMSLSSNMTCVYFPVKFLSSNISTFDVDNWPDELNSYRLK